MFKLKDKRISFTLIGVLFVIILAGCVASPVPTAINHVYSQNYKQALEIMRNEVRQPQKKTDEYLAYVYDHALFALANYVNFHDLEPGMDEEAKLYYKKGIHHARNDKSRQDLLNNRMANYYSYSQRNGLAIPYIAKQIKYAEKGIDTYDKMISYDSMASAYHDKGELLLRDHYRTKALSVAKNYFKPGARLSDKRHWIEYNQIINRRMENLSGQGNSDEILKLWEIQEPIVKKFFTPTFISYLRIAEYLAIGGDIDNATIYFERGKLIAEKEGHRLAPLEIAVIGGHIDLRAGRYKDAVENLEKGLKLKKAEKFSPGESDYRLMALAYEGDGSLDKAIEYFQKSISIAESLRSSYSVQERAAFFRSVIRKSYWGLIRCLTKRYLVTNSKDDFNQALFASELVRGRQFGEITDKRSKKQDEIDALDKLQSILNPDDILLYYTNMNKNIILFAVTNNQQRALIITSDQKKLVEQTKDLLKDLSNPSSALITVNRRLTTISGNILAPVNDMTRDKKSILVFPDGMLNAIPFELLTTKESGYRPIIEDKVVSVMPSLKFFARSKQDKNHRMSNGLFALANPKYSKSHNIEGLSKTDLRSITRGSNYLTYFAPLPETQSEVEHIANNFKKEPVKLLLGQNASESVLKGINLQPYRYLHLATHGILGKEIPGIGEPALVLSEEKGEDGFFTASEANQLNINAELTVLSACNTGSGEYFTGEGVMGMSRSFLLAGSRSVIVSLWQVPSLETEELMVSFYKHLLSGISSAKALRKAKLEMMNERSSTANQNNIQRGLAVHQTKPITKQYRHPFYWASFILIGKGS